MALRVLASTLDLSRVSCEAEPPALHMRAQNRFYRPELDLLRLMAFLMVWLSHALLTFKGLLPARLLALFEGAGSCGVPVFFFLSAYLITELLRREHLATGTVNLRFFYIRRVLRIWPLYLGVLLAYGLLGLRFHGFRIEPGRLAASALLAGNWYLALHPAITTPMRALWSISVEEQWYLLFPLARRAFSSGQLLLVCAAIFTAALLLLALLARFVDPSMLHVTAWVNSGVQFQYFALGTGAALLLSGRVPRYAGWARVVLAAGGMAAMLTASGATHFKQPIGEHSAASLIAGYLLAGVGTMALFFALLGISPTRCPGSLVRVGQVSFGLYVFHETGFFLADALRRGVGVAPGLSVLVSEKIFALVLTVALAFCSYYGWERPFLKLKRRWTLVRSREAL
jgi:peptidoglycan/LPS O-acetylase OafA/YrhL